MNERYLIINADDFGLCESMNQAICELFRLGAITSSSILSPAPMAMNACRYAKEGSFPVGVHWTLFSEWKEECWMPADKEKRDSVIDCERPAAC